MNDANKTTRRFKHCKEAWQVLVDAKISVLVGIPKFLLIKIGKSSEAPQNSASLFC